MEKYPLVSIIVPVYNVENYLPKCLESLRRQTWPALEIWLVNDGSTDGSPALCRAAAAEDARFHVLEQANAGVSAARNAGLAQATGKYLQFVDSDDWLADGACETLVRAAESAGAEMVVAHFYRVNSGRMATHGSIPGRQLLTRQEFAEEMLKAPANFYYGVLWNKLYCRNIVEGHAMRFEPDISWCEDFMFNLEYLKYARLVQTIPEPVYYYLKREDSLVNGRISLKRTVEMKRTTFACYKQLYQQLDLYEEQKASVYRYLISSAMDGIVLPEPAFLEERREQTEQTSPPEEAAESRRQRREQARELRQEKAVLERRLKQLKAEADLLEKRQRREISRHRRQDRRNA